MNRRRLGKTGYMVSEIGLGCWQLGGDFGPVGDETASAILDAANRLGVNFWDTADVYGGGLSESRIGAHSKNPDVLVATKLGRSGTLYPDKYTKAGVRESLEGSAKRLGVETLYLAQLHCVPIDVIRDGAIFNWMDDLQQAGLVRFYGASVETIEQAMICLAHENVSTLQIIFNIFRQDHAEKLLPIAADKDVGIIVRLPLASGLLSGKFGRDTQFSAQDHRNYNRDGQAFSVGETFSGIPFEKGVELVEELKGKVPADVPLAQMALRWILDHPAVSTIIAGVSRPAQLEDNVAATRLAPLPEATMADLASWYTQRVRPQVRGEI
ncbi:aldo/keto reductase [Devosia nitrariae]|uniref:Oxidoreductase n=1 Tax=Devosia nitrariae TaxID=2071872 RepID=A0ABQ5WBB0_9HYPH|nr:aldo/keto reductase [Devosia nitrariae]GLQ56911.1 oxidoreductase [Devosia nitrariae]